MSWFACEIWFPKPITAEQIQTVDTLIHQIGLKVSPRKRIWKEIEGSAQARGELKLPIDLFIERARSEDLKKYLLHRRDYLNERPDLQVDRDWSFQFANSAPFPGAPNADKYTREGVYPPFVTVLTHDVWRLMTGWGANAFQSESHIHSDYSQFEQIFAGLGYLPFASLFTMFLVPFDCLLMGYLALWIMDYLGGLLEVYSRTIEIPQTLDRLFEQNQQGNFPGKLYRFTKIYDTARGLETQTRHMIDADFLREWIKQPSFGLY